MGICFFLIHLFFALYLLESRASSQNQTRRATSASFSSSSSSSSSSLEDDEQESGAPTQNQPVQRADTTFHTPAPPDPPALEYSSPTRFAPVQIPPPVPSPSTPSRHPQKALLAHRPSPLALKKPESSRQKPSQNNELDSDSSLASLKNDGSKKSTALGIQLSSSLINSELLAESTALTTRVQEFQEGVRIRMKNKYARNHKVVVFQENDIVTLRIPKEDRAATDNHRVVVMIKSIPHEGRHQIQTTFGILDRLYPTGELNAVPLVDQKYYKADLLAAPSKSISLHTIAGKIATSSKVAVKRTVEPKH